MDRLVKKIRVVSIIVLCLFFNKIYGQLNTDNYNSLINTVPKEKVFLTTNTNMFLAGEALYYKLYCLIKAQNILSHISKIAYVELIGKSDNILFEHKLKLVNGIVNGDFFIPASTKTGHYKLIAYTKWTLNNSQNSFFEKDIYVINPYILNEEASNNKLGQANDIKIGVKETNILAQKDSYDRFRISTDSEVYKSRSKVLLEIESLLEGQNHGNYSISVRKIDSVDILNVGDNFRGAREGIDNKLMALPEIRGEIVSGKIKPLKSGLTVSDKIVALTIPGKDYVYKNVSTNKLGEFHFNLYEAYNNDKIIIQVVDEHKEDYEIDLNIEFIKPDGLNFYNLALEKNISNWLLDKSIQNQIESAYYHSKQDSIVSPKSNEIFYGRPSVEYLLDDYKRFPTIKETFVEVIEEAALRGNSDEQYRFVAYDYEEARSNAFNHLRPLVLFDGVQIQNNLDIVHYESSKIKKIDVVRGIYFNGPSVYNGIIDIKTNNGDFDIVTKAYLKHFDFRLPQRSKIYFNPKYESKSLDKIPDYRTQLLWMPNITIDSNLKEISFYTSDVEGAFEISIEGYNTNGNYIKLKKIIEVKNN
ncbi:hypothetical protein Q4Q39_08080 [Flavivirga amylovorans]|uniref:Carboxypeptidase regulatory-like domain-containing protein n=1 Tax=Flavivirga amylovorans TaxID=870486 RepID=A0ABT8X092_9FLAO|nr:hypothetical protein [Flavivirga amylovorans]MDO5987351.1 hypothetical protein [Flavivirga amylovorans]